MRLTPLICTSLAVVLATGIASNAISAPVGPYTENFTSNSANWTDGAPVGPANWVASGGPDGSSYASISMNTQALAAGTPAVAFRGQDETNASNMEFVGDWIAGGINYFSAYVRHSAPEPLNFFARFATPSNFPGVGADDGTIVQPNTWTLLDFVIHPSQINSTLFPEGPPTFYNSTFTNVGHVQIGFDVAAAMAESTTAYTYDIDQVTVTPEPASFVLAAIGGAFAFGLRRRREL